MAHLSCAGKETQMKKTIVFLLSAILLLGGCTGKPSETGPGAVIPTDAPVASLSADAFYTRYKESSSRPVAVMVDNDNGQARPHAGLTEAYMIYEVPVEGGATRLMALFYPEGKEKIGPVRSSRHYFLDYVLEHDALYTHFGYSPRALADIPALGINNLNGVEGSGADIFWREDEATRAYHSAFTSMEKILNKIGVLGYRTEREKSPLVFAEQVTELAEGKDATSVKIPYTGFYSSGFSYDAENGNYKKLIGDVAHPIQEEGELRAKNIIIMQMKTYPLGDGSARINIDTVGTGKGQYITMGKSIPITWEKTSRSAKTVWKNEKGEEIKLNPGTTWVMLLPSGVSPQIG